MQSIHRKYKMTRVEIETKLVNELHYLPTEAIETLLTLALLIKTKPQQSTDSSELNSENNSNALSAGLALHNFLKKYQTDPIDIDIDTRIFEQARAIETDREITL